MKKFFSILCAFAIVLSANAAQVSMKDVLAKKVEKKEVRSKLRTSAHAANSATFKAFDKKTTPVAKVATKKHVTAGMPVAGLEKKNLKDKVAFKAPQAKKEAIDVTIASWDLEDWGTDGELVLYGEGNTYAFYFDLYYGGDNEDLELGKTYTVEDLYVSAETGEQYGGVFYDGEWHYGLKELSVTKTIDEDNLVHFVGSVVDSLDAEFTFHYDEVVIVIPDGGEFEADEASFTFFATDNDAWYKFIVDELDATFRFDIVVAEGLQDVEPGHEYTLDDMIESYTYVYFGDEKRAFTEVSFLKTANEDKSADLNVTATDENGSIWKLHYQLPAPPAAENFETITANVTMTKELYWFWYLYTIEGADEHNAIVLEIMPDESIFGTWVAGDEITGVVTPVGGEESEIYGGEVTIEKTAEGFKVTGAVLCENRTEYTLDLTYVIPEPTREEVLMIDGLQLDVYATAWQLSGFNGDSTQFVSIAAYADEITGNYTDADLAEDYTYIYTDLVWDEEGNLVSGNEFSLLKADLTVQFTEEDSTIVIAGSLRGQNGDDVPEFTMLLKGKIPAPEVSDMTFEFTADEEGITVTPSNDEDAWDWYVASEEVFEYYGADYIAEAIYSNYGNSYAVTGEQKLTFEDDLAYYTEEGGKFYLIVWGAGAREITTEVATFEFEVEAQPGGDCTQYDAEEGNDFIVEFAEYDIDDQYLEEYGELIVSAETEDGEYISLEILLPEGAETLVAGEYPVLADGEGQLVFAGELDLSVGYIYGSFAGYLSAQGGISIPLWLLVDGKVVVAEDGSITVDAVNCAGAKIQCKLGAPAQGNKYDAEDDFTVDFAEYTIDDSELAEYGVLFIEAQNEENEYISIELWLPEDAEELVAGVYPVAEEEGAAQTVTACWLEDYIYGSFAGVLTEDGYINVPFWFFATGNVTVNEDLSITVDVLNTKGAAIKCTLKPEEQGIENIKLTEDANKVVVDGAMYIVRDNKLFNVQGARVR